MDLSFNLSAAAGYHSKTQIARILTESWVSDNLFCPRCGNPHINHFQNNRPVADFYCEECKSEFELKSKNGAFGASVVDGAYDTMISRITDNHNPDFLFMNYSMSAASVTDLIFVPKHFFTPAIIEKRKPLSPTARRAGWTGCNILLGKIPEQGRISVIAHSIAQPVDSVVQLSKRASQLEKQSLTARGWLLDVLNCVNDIPKNDFTLAEVYQYEQALAELHPNNHFLQAKIRQQLQVLRDAGVLEFLGEGHYRKIK